MACIACGLIGLEDAVGSQKDVHPQQFPGDTSRVALGCPLPGVLPQHVYEVVVCAIHGECASNNTPERQIHTQTNDLSDLCLIQTRLFQPVNQVSLLMEKQRKATMRAAEISK